MRFFGKNSPKLAPQRDDLCNVGVDFCPGRARAKRKSQGFSDIFVTMLESDGSCGWTRTIGGVASDIGYGIAADSASNILVSGWFENRVDFNPGRGVDEHVSVDYSRDVFVTKLGADGSYCWTRTFGGPLQDIGWRIATDSQGAAIVVGEFCGTVDFDPGEGEDLHVSEGDSDIFITKLGSDGSYQWTHTAGGPFWEGADAVATDALGNTYSTGGFQNTVDFDRRGGGDVHVSNGLFDVFVTKRGPDGSYHWTRTFGGEAIESGFGIALDDSGVLVVGGNYSGTVDFDFTEGVDEHTAKGGRDAFITRMTADGGYIFTDTFGGSQGNDGVQDLAIGADGSVIACGSFESLNVDFDPTSGVDPHSSNGSFDLFITKHYCGQCEVLEGHHVQGKRGKIKATIQTTAPGGTVKIEYTGPGDPIIESFDIDDTGQAKFTLKKLKKGDYHCLITKIKDPAGHPLCQGPLAPRPVTVK